MGSRANVYVLILFTGMLMKITESHLTKLGFDTLGPRLRFWEDLQVLPGIASMPMLYPHALTATTSGHCHEFVPAHASVDTDAARICIQLLKRVSHVLVDTRDIVVPGYFGSVWSMLSFGWATLSEGDCDQIASTLTSVRPLSLRSLSDYDLCY